jgi:replicative DNA helicase
MRIKNLSKIKELIKAKLPEYLNDIGCKTNGTKVQCPNTEAHEHGDEGKLSAAFLPDSQNRVLYCFVEERTFDIFDIHSIKTGIENRGQGFYELLKDLAGKYNIPIEEEYEYSAKEKATQRQRNFLEKLHKLSCSGGRPKKGTDFYKRRNISKDKLKTWRIGYLSPDDITPEMNKECKMLFDYRLLSVFHKPGLVLPILDDSKQYSGIIIRMFDTEDDDPYIKICIKGSNLFNIERVRGKESLTIVEGPFDAIALHPEQNVVGCLTNVVNDANLEKIAGMDMKKIHLALDPDNMYRGTARDGFLRTILRMKNLDTEISLVSIPVIEGEPKPDPDEYMKTHSLEDFRNLPKIDAITYLIKNYEKGLIKADVLYDFIAGCPNLIRKEAFINQCSKALDIGKRQLTKSIDDISEKKDSFNMIQYVQEKDSYDELLEGFTELAWNKNFAGVPSGFPLFDKKFGGFEDTLYLFAGFPEMGKTTFLLNFVYRLAMCKNTFVAFYSLDDGAKRAIVPRLMSITSGLTSRQVRQPEKSYEKQWFEGMKKLKELKENMIIKDGSDIRTVDDLDNFVKIHSTIAEERGKKFIIVIDNLHDLNASTRRDLEATQNAQRVASYLKRLPQRMNCPILSTAEVPKSAGGRPTGKDIKESIDLWYASRFVAGIYSNYHQVKNAQDSNLHWVDENGKYHPIMELFVSKNQTGEAEHGTLFYKFNFTNNQLIECNERETKMLAEGGFLTYME